MRALASRRSLGVRDLCQTGHQRFDIGVAMRGGERDAQARAAGGHRGRAYRGDIVAALEKPRARHDGSIGRAEQDRLDRRLGIGQRQAGVRRQ